MFGWYSTEQEDIAGSHVYSTADGREVIVSCVTQDDVAPSGTFAFVRVGPVGQWLRVCVDRSPERSARVVFPVSFIRKFI